MPSKQQKNVSFGLEKITQLSKRKDDKTSDRSKKLLITLFCLSGVIVAYFAKNSHSSYRSTLDNELSVPRPPSSHPCHSNFMKMDNKVDLTSVQKFFLEAYKRNPSDVWNVLGLAEIYDVLAEKHRSNKLLESAIEKYSEIVDSETLVFDDQLLAAVGLRLAERLGFRGFSKQAISTLNHLSERLPINIPILNKLGVELLIVGNFANSKKKFEAVLAIDPNSAFALVHIGFILKTHDQNFVEAIRFFENAFQISESPQIHDGKFYYHYGDALQRIGKVDEARKVYIAGAQRKVFLSPDQRSLYNCDGLQGRPLWKLDQLGKYAVSLKSLQRHWEIIRDEGLANLKVNGGGKFVDEDENLRQTGDWKQLTLWSRGKKNAGSCLKTPKTCEILAPFQDAIECTRGQIKFSVMSPGTHVWPHTGPTNCRLRGHLGLIVPEPRSKIALRVAKERVTWREGEWFVFDDSFEHEVWHNGTSDRLVLIVDFWHPDLADTQKRVLSPI